MNSNKKNILSYSLEELGEIVASLGDKKFRAAQLHNWIKKGKGDFFDMMNIPSLLLENLDKKYYIPIPKIIDEQKSDDGTVKCLEEFYDGERVESVFMKYHFGNSICISTQAGCRMGCKFCASTKKGLSRHLMSTEMLGEVLAMRNLTGEDIRHIVLMGIGEPFDNYDEVYKFLQMIHDEYWLGLSYRNITVSTCGLVPMMRRFGDDFPQVNLAVSLHAPNDEIRRKIMPISNKYSIDEVISTAMEHTYKTKRRVSFEYAMIYGVNDSIENATELARLMKGWLSHVNLIPLNSVDGSNYEKSDKRRINEFKSVLEKNGVNVTIRRTLGTDIDAACGQLRSR